MTAPVPNPDPVPPSWGEPLTEQDYSTLSSSWITREIADAAMLRRVDACEGREVVGQKGNRDCAGVLIPYYWPGQPHAYTYRLRRHSRLEARERRQAEARQEVLRATAELNRLYLPPGIAPGELQDVAIPLAIAEGEKKALALSRLARYENGSSSIHSCCHSRSFGVGEA